MLPSAPKRDENLLSLPFQVIDVNLKLLGIESADVWNCIVPSGAEKATMMTSHCGDTSRNGKWNRQLRIRSNTRSTGDGRFSRCAVLPPVRPGLRTVCRSDDLLDLPLRYFCAIRWF